MKLEDSLFYNDPFFNHSIKTELINNSSDSLTVRVTPSNNPIETHSKIQPIIQDLVLLKAITIVDQEDGSGGWALRVKKEGFKAKDIIHQEDDILTFIEELWPSICLHLHARELKERSVDFNLNASAQKVQSFCESLASLTDPVAIHEYTWLAKKLLTEQEIIGKRLHASQQAIGFKEEVAELLKEIRGERPSAPSSSWLGGLIQRGLSWLSEGVENQENLDWNFVKRFGDRILDLSAKGQDEELKYYENVVWALEDYFAAKETHEIAQKFLSDQKMELLEGGQAFSPAAYCSFVEKTAVFGKLAHEYPAVPQMGARAQEQERQALFELEEFVDDLFPALKAELAESEASWKRSLANRDTQRLSMEYHQFSLTVNACQEWVKSLEALCAKDLSEKMKTHCLANLQKAQSILQKAEASLDQMTGQHVIDSEVTYDPDQLKKIRMEERPLTRAQRHRQWEQRRLAKLSEPDSPTRKLFYQCFFFYLQAVSPSLIACFGTPVGRQDYRYYLRMMAQSVDSAGDGHEGYDYYLEKARSFGVDQDFLEHYDKFLRHEIQVQYSPDTMIAGESPTLDKGKQSLLESAFTKIQQVAPASIAAWTAQFLGLNAEGKMASQATGWEMWVQQTLAPEVRNQYFGALVDYFEDLGTVAPPENNQTQDVLFGYECFKMYTDLKSSSSSSVKYLQLANEYPKYRAFLSDYHQYLTLNPPEKSLVATPIVNIASAYIGPNQTPEVISAVKANDCYLKTWPKSATDFLGTFQVPSSEAPLSDRIQLAQANELPKIDSYLSRLTTLKGELTALHENLPFLGHKLTTLSHHISEVQQRYTNLRSDMPLTSSETLEWLQKVSALQQHAETMLVEYDQMNLAYQLKALEVLRETVEGPPIGINDHALLHILGDSFGSGTKLEGMPSIQPLKIVLNLLSHKLKVLAKYQDDPSHPLPHEADLVEMLEKAERLIQSRGSDSFHATLSEMLQNAIPGNTILLPGGWVGKPSGHAIYYEYTKQENGLFTVRVYNSGAGISLGQHALVVMMLKTKMTFAELNDVPLENILSRLHVRALQALSTSVDDKDFGYNADDIYVKLLSLLGGKPRTQALSSNDIRKAQTSGTCSLMSLLTALSYQRSAPQTVQSEFELGLKALIEYESKLKLSSYNEQSIRLLQKCLSAFAHSLEDLQSSGRINHLEYLYASQKVGEIQSTINNTSANAEIAKRKVELISPSSIHSVDLKPPSDFPVLKITEAMDTFSLADWIPNKLSLSVDLARISSSIEQTHLKGTNPSAVLSAMHQVMAKLPLEWILEEIKGLMSKDCEEIISSISHIAELEFSNHFILTRDHPERKNKLSPQVFVDRLSAWTICHALMMKILELQPTNFLVDEILKYHVLDYSSLSMIMSSPKSDSNLSRIRQYWNEISQKKDSVDELKSVKGDLSVVGDFAWRYLSMDENFLKADSGSVSRYLMDLPSVRQKRDTNVIQEKEFYADAIRDRRDEGKENFFPDYFYQLLNLTVSNSFIFRYPIEATLYTRHNGNNAFYDDKNRPTNPSIKIDVDVESKDFQATSSFPTIPLTNARKQAVLGLSLYSRVKEGFFKDILFFNPANPQSILYQPIKFGGWNKDYANSFNYVRPSADEALFRSANLSENYSIQTIREIYALVSNGSSQILQTLEYFIQHPHLMGLVEYQELFQGLFFEPGRLLEEFTVAPQEAERLISRFAALISDQCDRAKVIESWDTMAYFLRISTLCERYVAYANAELGMNISPSPAFLDSQSIARNLLQTPHLAQDAKASLCLVLALTYEQSPSPLTEDQLTELLALMAQYMPYRASLPEDQVLAGDALLEINQAPLAQLLQGSKASIILNSIMRSIDLDFKEQSWKAQDYFPLFSTSDESTFVDVSRALVYHSSALPIRVGEDILNNPTLNTIVDPPERMHQYGISSYAFTSPDGQAYRIHKPIRGDLQIKKQIDGIWHQYLPKSSLSLKQQGLVLDNQLWAVVQPRSNEVKVFSPDGLKPLYVISSAESDYKIEEVCHENFEEKLELADTVPDFISYFEDPSMALCWMLPTKEIALIEFPRFNLTLENFQGKLYSRDHPGYYLSEWQAFPKLNGYQFFLLMENPSGQRIVLLPYHEILSSSEGCLNTQGLSINPNLEQNRNAFFTYRVHEVTGELVPDSDISRFYLAHAYLRTMDYAKAHNLLRNFGESLRAFDQAEAQLLTIIADLGVDPVGKENGNDRDPKALAQYLYAAYLLNKNAVDFPSSSGHAGWMGEKLDNLIQHYLENVELVGDVGLTVDEEMFLLLYSESLTLQNLHRLRYLTDGGTSDSISVISDNPLEELNVEPLKKPDDGLASRLAQSLREHPTNQNLVRLHPEQDFFALYKLVRGELQGEDADHAYEAITGISTFPISKADQVRELTAILNMYPNDRAALILKVILLNPEKFRPSSDFNLNFYFSQSENVLRKVIEPAWKILEQNQGNVGEASQVFNAPQLLVSKEDIEVRDQPLDMEYQLCHAPYNPSTLSNPVFNLESAVSKVSTLGYADAAQQEDLARLFDAPVNSRLAKSEFVRMKGELESYLKRKMDNPSALQRGEYFTIHDATTFERLQASTIQQLELGEEELASRELDLLKRANRSADTKSGQAAETLLTAKGKKPLDINDLIHIFLTRDVEAYHNANANLSVEEIYQLQIDVQEYLIRSTHLQHLRRLSNNMKSIQKLTVTISNSMFGGLVEERSLKISPPISEPISQLLDDLNQQAAATRGYVVEDHPEYLVFEYYSNMLLRPTQVENLDLLRIKDGQITDPEKLGVVLESLMGSGKTEVLMPLLGQLCANGENLCIGVIPESLLPDMSARLSRILGSSFNRSVEVFEFRNENASTTKDLDMIKLRLEHAISSRRVLYTSGSTIQRVYLKLWDSWRMYALDPSESNKMQFDIMRDIMRIWKTQGVVVIDEADTVFSARKEYQYALEQPKPIDMVQCELVTYLFQILLDPQVVPDMRFEFGGTSTNARVFNEQDYHQKIARRLINHLVENALGVDHPEVKIFFSRLTKDQKHLVHSYLSERKLSERKQSECLAFISSIESKLVKDLLSLAKEEVQRLIPLTVSKKMNQYYGANKTQAGIYKAIPYHGSNTPSKNSEYDVYETLNYTVQLGLAEGIPTAMVEQEIEELRNEALAFHNSGKAYIGSDVHKRFLTLTGGKEQITLFGATPWIQEITNYVNSKQTLKLDFIKKYALSQVTHYPQKMRANAQVFNFLFKTVAGFTGTQNEGSVPTKLDVLTSDITTGSTLESLWKNRENIVNTFTAANIQNFFKELYQQHPQLKQMKAFIDAGAVTRGISHESIARQSLSVQDDSINGVAFYDEDENLKTIQKGAERSVDITLSKLPPEERITFYDQKHTTGSNIKQSDQALGVMTIGKDTVFRDFAQAAWRMRGLSRSQTIKIILDKEVEDILRITLNRMLEEQVPEKIEFEHVLIFLIYNQGLVKGDDNFRTFKQKISAFEQEAVLDAVLADDVSAEDLIPTFSKVSELCMTATSPSPWELFGVPQEEKDSGEVINDMVSQELKSAAFQALATDPALKTHTDQQAVKKRIQEIAERSKPIVHETLLAYVGAYNTGAELEIETTHETLTQMETLTQKEKVSTLDQRLNQWYDVKDFPTATRADLASLDYFMERPLGDPRARFISLGTALSTESSLEEFMQIFDPALMGSLRLIRKAEPTTQDWHWRDTRLPYALFNFYQKAITDILVVIDRETQKLQFILGDLNDGVEWKKNLEHNYQSTANATDETHCVLLKPTLGVYRASSADPAIADLDKNGEFQRLLVQAKFFNGEINYTEKEIPYLEAWIREHGANKMERLFQRILTWKDVTRSQYPNSIIAQMLRAPIEDVPAGTLE